MTSPGVALGDHQPRRLEDLPAGAQVPRRGPVPHLLAREESSKEVKGESLGPDLMRTMFVLWAAALLLACTPDRDAGPAGDSATTAPAASSVDSAAACFVAGQSVLARDAGNVAAGTPDLRGWIRLVALDSADSASATLVDSDGLSLDATWWRNHPDSLVVAAFNDFVRVEMRLRHADSSARGQLSAHSDAALERDSTGALREFRRTRKIDFQRAPCENMPSPVGGAAIDVLAPGTPRPGRRFDPSKLRRGQRVGALTADSVHAQRTLADSSFIGIARFRGRIELSGWTLRNPDPDLYRVLTCFEADSASAVRLPRWSGDERRAWFCFSNRAEAARALGPPSEGVRATIVIDGFTILRGLSDEVNSARFVRLVRGGMRG